jgi:hypothetical protein
VQFNGITNIPSLARDPQVDFAAMALAAGYSSAQRIDNHAAWVAALPGLLSQEGASFVDLGVRSDVRLIGPQRPQPLLPDIQFVRMRMGVRKLSAELRADLAA